MSFEDVQLSCVYVGGNAVEIKTEADSDDMTECPHDNQPTTHTGRLIEVKTEADSNDITEHAHSDKSGPYLCTVCNKRYRTKHQLTRHRVVHTGKYKCTECGKYFHHNAALKIHSRVHSGEKPFECSVCSKRFIKAGDLVVHSRSLVRLHI